MTTTSFVFPKVEVAFVTAPLATTPIWTDVSQWAQHVSIRRGKSHELGQQQPGVCTVLFDDRDRRFDPTNTASPYYGNLLTADQASVEVSTSGFVAFNCTLTRTSGAFPVDGSWALAATTTASGSDTVFQTLRGTSGVSATPGQVVNGMVSMKCASAVFRTAWAFVEFFDAGGTSLGSTSGTHITIEQAAWHQASVTATAPAGTAYMALAGDVTGCSTSEVIYADAFGLGGINGPWVPGGSRGLLPMRKLRISAAWNLLSAEQASFETGTGRLTATNCALTNPPLGYALDGAYVLQMSSSAAGTMTATTATGTSGMPVTAGQTYSVTASFIAAAATSRTVGVGVTWFTVAGASISSSTSTVNGASNAGWTTVQGTALTAPTNAAYADVFLEVLSTGGAAEVWYVDEVGLFPAAGVTAWSPGGTQYLFTGYVESWPLKWVDATNSQVEVTAVDGLKVLNLDKVAGNAIRPSILADTPSGYWPFYDPIVSTTAADVSGGAHAGTYTGVVTLGVDGANPADLDTAMYVTTAGHVEMPSAASISGTGAFTIELWFKQNASTITRAAHLFSQNAGAGAFSLNVLTDNTLQLVADDGSGNGGTLVSVATISADQWVHVVAVKSGTTGPSNWNLYIDGAVSNGTATLFGTGNCNLLAGAFAFAGQWNGGTFSDSYAGVMQHAAIYTSALNSTQVAAHYDTTAGFTSQALTGTRIGKVLDEVGWPAADRMLDAGQFQMQPVTKPLYTTKSLAYLQSLIDSEGYPADLFIDGQGRVVFHDRAHTTPAVAATFGDAAGELPYELAGTTAPVLDDLNIYNEIVYQADNGQAQIAADATSQTAYVIRTLSKTGLQNASDADVATVVADLLARYKDPVARLAALGLRPSDDPNLWGQILARDLDDRITVHRTFFAGGGSLFSLDVRIEGVNHDISPFEWRTVWQLAPT